MNVYVYKFIKVFHQSFSFVPSVPEPMNGFTGILLYFLHKKKIDIAAYSTLQAFSNPIFFKIKTTCNGCEKNYLHSENNHSPQKCTAFFFVFFFYFELLISFKGPNRKKEYIAAQGKVY